MFLSARNRILGSLLASRFKFQRLLKSFQANWNAMKVFPVPVAIVSKCISTSSNRLKNFVYGIVLVVTAFPVPPLSSKGTSTNLSLHSLFSE